VRAKKAVRADAPSKGPLLKKITQKSILRQRKGPINVQSKLGTEQAGENPVQGNPPAATHLLTRLKSKNGFVTAREQKSPRVPSYSGSGIGTAILSSATIRPQYRAEQAEVKLRETSPLQASNEQKYSTYMERLIFSTILNGQD
jgi:hypothetical protein